MKFKFYLLVLFTLGTGLSQIVAESPNPEHLAAAEDGFAFKLFKELAAEQPVTNIFISPYSAETVLQMVANGAVGKTKTEMQQVLPAHRPIAEYRKYKCHPDHCQSHLVSTRNAG
jgi:serine protease inhibitor